MCRNVFKATLIATLALSAAANAATPDTAGTPGARATAKRNTADAETLWKEGRDAYQDGEYDDAAEALGRLIQKHPGATGFLEAHFLLGRAQLELGKPAKAIAPLQYYVNGSRKPLDAAEGRLWLGHAYLSTRKFHEAYFMGVEVEKGSYPEKPDLRPRAYLLISDAEAGLGQAERATAASTQARQAIETLPPEQRAPLESEWLRQQIDLKTASCALLPSKGPLTEDQARAQIERRGLCVLEALNLFHEQFPKEAPAPLTRSSKALVQAIDGFSRACDNPPEPPPLQDPLHPRGRTAQEKARYRNELAQLLGQIRTDKLRSAIETLKSWRLTAPSSAVKSIDLLIDFAERAQSPKGASKGSK